MKKRSILLGVIMAGCMMGSISASASTGIDLSVFENKDIYEVEIDDFEDTGSITFSSAEDAPMSLILGGTEDEEENSTVLGYYEIRMIEDNTLAAMKFSLLYNSEDWVFADKIIFKTKNNRYTFDVEYSDSEVDGGKVTEVYDIIFNSESIKMLEDIANDGVDGIDCRFSGDSKIDFYIILDHKGIGTMYNDFVEAGGLEQDFSLIDEAYPCEIKELTK